MKNYPSKKEHIECAGEEKEYYEYKIKKR